MKQYLQLQSKSIFLEIQNAIIKKSNSLTTEQFIESVNFENTVTILNKESLEKWVSISIDDRLDSVSISILYVWIW